MDDNYFVSGIEEIDNLICKLEDSNIKLPDNVKLVVSITRDEFKLLKLPSNISTNSIIYNTRSGIKVEINSNKSIYDQKC